MPNKLDNVGEILCTRKIYYVDWKLYSKNHLNWPNRLPIFDGFSTACFFSADLKKNWKKMWFLNPLESSTDIYEQVEYSSCILLTSEYYIFCDNNIKDEYSTCSYILIDILTCSDLRLGYTTHIIKVIFDQNGIILAHDNSWI